uniref:Uncharacterized protein n=1 Tax=Avena sativa TaxID=4498 RepID=A0ACD5WLZ3_AVESA
MDAGPSAMDLDAGASTTPMATPNLNWTMVEPFVFRVDDADSFADEGHAPIKAHGLTSRGDSFTVGLRIRPPPEISRLYLHWPGGPDPKKGSSCDLVAAHGNLLLLRLTSSPLPPLKKDESPVYPQEDFICRASSSSIKLERIATPLVLTGNKDKLRVTAQGPFPLHTVGILCCGEDFAIAQLRLTRPNREVADLCVFRSSESKWELEQRCPIQFKGEYESFDLDYWKTDRVLAFKTYLFWVDYCTGGMLSSEVFQARPTIRYIRLPIVGNRNLGYEVRPFQDMYRSLCVTKDGQELIFIDIVSEYHASVGRLSASTVFSITVHALKTDSAALDWLKVYSVRSDDLSLFKPLTYPLVSMHEANIAYFLMPEKVLDGINKIWMVTIDMGTKKIMSICPYVNGVEGLKGKDSEMVKQKSRILQPFIPLELPEWLYPNSSSKRVKKTTKTESGSKALASKRVKKATKT